MKEVFVDGKKAQKHASAPPTHTNKPAATQTMVSTHTPISSADLKFLTFLLRNNGSDTFRPRDQGGHHEPGRTVDGLRFMKGQDGYRYVLAWFAVPVHVLSRPVLMRAGIWIIAMPSKENAVAGQNLALLLLVAIRKYFQLS